MWICVAPRCEHTSKVLRYSMHSWGILQFYLHTLHSSANGMSHTCLFLPSQSQSSFIDPVGMEGLVGLGDWLHTEINVRHRELNPGTIAHPSTNRARHRLTSLIETNALPLCQTTICSWVCNHQVIAAYHHGLKAQVQGGQLTPLFHQG